MSLNRGKPLANERDAAPFTGDLFFFSVVPTEAIWISLLPAGSYTLRFTAAGQSEQVIPMAPATLGNVQFLPSGDPQLSLSGTAGRAYRVERTGSLEEPVWVELGTVTMDAAGQGVFVDTIAQNVSPLFYRAVAD